MSPATRDDNLPSAGDESTATPGPTTNESTQNGRIEDNSTRAPGTGCAGSEGVPIMPQPPTDAASSVQDADEDEADTPKAITPAASLPDPLGAAPHGAAQPPTNGHIDNGAQGPSNELANGRRSSADPLYARRRAGTGVRYILASLSILFQRRNICQYCSQLTWVNRVRTLWSRAVQPVLLRSPFHRSSATVQNPLLGYPFSILCHRLFLQA